MRRHAARHIVGTLTIVLLAVALVPSYAQRRTLWYRGYFDGKVTIETGRNAGYYYRPSRPTKYPLHESIKYSDYLPCGRCGYYHRPGAYVPGLQRRCHGKGTHLDPDVVYVAPPYRLPGQYYFEKQNHFTFRTPITVDWPFVKYDQRTESDGRIPMGRTRRVGRRVIRTR